MRNKSGQPDSSSGIILLSNKQLSKVPDGIPEAPIYLDFSSNHIKNLDFPKDYNTLISLHLNENPLNKLDNIRFNNLRSLSLDFCNLKSMKQIPQLPNLISLSLVGNSLSSFENFHIFPNLTKIDLRGNSVSFTPIHTIAAVCSLRLSTINGRSVTEKEFQEAFSLSPIVGHALRKGRNPAPQSDEKASSLTFLSKENPLDVKNIGGCLVIRCPIEETSNVKWYQSSSNELEWELLDCTSRTLPVTPMMFQRLIKCEYGNKSFYTSDVIQKDDSGRNCLSFTDQPAIIGTGTVGSILSLNSQQSFPTKINWRFSNSHDSIGSCPVLIVPPEAKGQKIIAEVFPFSPAFEKVSFAPLTTEIQISNVQETELIRLSIPDTIIEDEPFEIDYETYPANAKLHFTIDSANSFESPFITIANLKSKTVFTPTSTEVGKFLRVTTFVGDRQYSAYSKYAVEKVKATLKRSLICGENKTGHPRIFLFEFSDGVESSGHLQHWFVLDGDRKVFISNDKIVVPNEDHIGMILGVDVTVWFDNDQQSSQHRDNESTAPKIARKEQTFTIKSESPIEKSDKPTIIVDVREPVEDSKISMNGSGQWLISDIHARGGFRAIVESEIYTPRASDIGKYIRFCEEDTDVIIGPVLPSQSPIKSVVLKTVLPGKEEALGEISSDLSVGTIVRAQLNFYQERGAELANDDLRIKWIRCSRAAPDRVIQEGGNEYVISYSDYGSKIKARVESTDWQKDSDLTPIIKRGDYNGQIIRGKPSFGSELIVQFSTSPTSTNSTSSYHSSDSYNNEPKTIRWYHNDEPSLLCEGTSFLVRFIDINHRIRCEVNGKYNELTEVVPQVAVVEGQLIKFADVFHRELTDKTGVLWFRYVFEESEWKEISARTSYRLKKADVNSVIRVVSYQIHSDGSKTSEIFADIGPIEAKPPNSKGGRSEDDKTAALEGDEEEVTSEESGNDKSPRSSNIKLRKTSSNNSVKEKVAKSVSFEDDEENNRHQVSASNSSKNLSNKDNDSVSSRKSNRSRSSSNNSRHSSRSIKTQSTVDNFDEYDDENNESSASNESSREQQQLPLKRTRSSNDGEDRAGEEAQNSNEEEEENGKTAHLQFTKHGQLVIVGDFDDNDDVKFFWRRWRGDHFDEINDTSTRKMTPCFSMVGYEIDGGYQIQGSFDVVWSNKVFIDHALPSPEADLIENGALVPGCVLECRTGPTPRYNPREQLRKLKRLAEEKRKRKLQKQQQKKLRQKQKQKLQKQNEFDEKQSSSESDESSEESDDFLDFEDNTSNFEDDLIDDSQPLRIKFAWKRWNGMQFSRISNDSSLYKVADEDTDCYVCCDVYYVDNEGNHGPPTSVETSGPVSSEAVVIEGDPVVASLLNAEGYDDFMRNCRFIWERRDPSAIADKEEEDEGDEDGWIVVGKKRAYRCSCDDVGCYIRVICETKDERRASLSIGPVLMNKEVESNAKEIAKNGVFKFKTKEQNGARWKVEASGNQFKLISKQNNKSSSWKNVEVGAAISSEKKIEIFIGSFKVSVVPVLHGNEKPDSGLDRDICILALRMIKEKALHGNNASNKKK